VRSARLKWFQGLKMKKRESNGFNKVYKRGDTGVQYETMKLQRNLIATI
jgi:hypothetical protein